MVEIWFPQQRQKACRLLGVYMHGDEYKHLDRAVTSKSVLRWVPWGWTRISIERNHRCYSPPWWFVSLDFLLFLLPCLFAHCYILLSNKRCLRKIMIDFEGLLRRGRNFRYVVLWLFCGQVAMTVPRKSGTVSTDKHTGSYTGSTFSQTNWKRTRSRQNLASM